MRIAKLYGEDVAEECQLGHAAKGTLIHRHECPALMPDEGWGVLPPNVPTFMERIRHARAHALQTRGILALKLQLPRLEPGGWFRWVVGGPELADDGSTWYIDGSFIDGPSPFTGRAGFAIVIVAPSGALQACGLGAPPTWVTNSAAAEAWALVTTLRSSPFPPRITTDCLGLIRQLSW